MEELETVFSSADAALDAAAAEGSSARAAVEVAMESAWSALKSGACDLALAGSASRACRAESEWLETAASLPKAVEAATEAAKRFLEAPAPEPEPVRPAGFVSRFLGSRQATRPSAPSQHPLAQAAYAGRQQRLDAARGQAAAAAAHVRERRDAIGELVFCLQEAALKESRAQPAGDRRRIFSLEAAAASFGSHGERLAVLQRSVSRAAAPAD